MTTTSTHWPLVNEDRLAVVGRWSNAAYCWAIALVVLPVTLVRLGRRRLDAWPRILLLHLAVLVPVALVFAGEPRLRLTSDLFGVLLMAAIVGRWIERRSAQQL